MSQPVLDGPTHTTSAARSHVPALDGIRGLAIALVMACHFTGGAVPVAVPDKLVLHATWSGWIGVDLFFVLSGFLITTILLDSRESASYFRNFYIRRTLRIFPLYYSILLAMLVLPPLVLSDVSDNEWFTTISDRAPWFWTYTSNVDIAIQDTWVGGLLGHFWSLAVEEQFYLLWPAVVWLVPSRRLRWVCIAIIVGAVAVRLELLSLDMKRGAFTLMPARADALAVGAWVAAAIRTGIDITRLQRAAWWTLAVTSVGILSLLARHRPLDVTAVDVQLLGHSFLAFGCGAMIVLALDARGTHTLFGRVFRHSSLRFLGKYSYAMYCVHPLVQHALKSTGAPLTIHTFPAIAGSILPGVLVYSSIVFAFTTVIALVSWHLLEKHFLRLKNRFAA